MALLVQKYGGTSVANLERIQRVADRVADSRRSGNQLVVVVSAMSPDRKILRHRSGQDTITQRRRQAARAADLAARVRTR